MRNAMLSGFVLALSCSAWAGEAQRSSVKGDYVEARTASVFAGACHFNGEVVTTGQDALMAWNIQSGRWNGVDLAGTRAIAVVKSEANLADKAPRRTELVVDAAASSEQARALIDALSAKYSRSLGEVISVRRAPIQFQHQGKQYSVSAAGIASLSVEAMPNDECCKMPHLVWYEPLVPLAHRKVGYTKNALYSGGSVGDPWTRSDENSAFYGAFAM